MLAAAGLRLRINGAVTFGAAIGDESQAFPMHGCGRQSCSDPCVAVLEVNGSDTWGSDGLSLNGGTWRRGVFQNAVGGGERRSSAFPKKKKGNVREREGRFGGKGPRHLECKKNRLSEQNELFPDLQNEWKAMGSGGWRRGKKADELVPGAPSAA